MSTVIFDKHVGNCVIILRPPRLFLRCVVVAHAQEKEYCYFKFRSEL